MLTFLIGGARNGKSRYAESLCVGTPRVAYMAPARANDEETSACIAQHRHDRPAHWDTFEGSLAIAPFLGKLRQEYNVLFLDFLIVWSSNLLFHFRRQPSNEIENRVLAQLDEIASATVGTYLNDVAIEVGGGIIPATKVVRIFRDLQGLANLRVAALPTAFSWWLPVSPYKSSRRTAVFLCFRRNQNEMDVGCLQKCVLFCANQCDCLGARK
jgi:adenosylcobinamide kinase/adenosylcobinamide-phosphate guanylyltransferase